MKKKTIIFLWVLLLTLSMVIAGCYRLSESTPENPTYYQLTVSMTDGVAGAPGTGTSRHVEGTRIDYGYRLETGYKDLLVLHNDIAVSADGSIHIMKDYHFKVSAVRK